MFLSKFLLHLSELFTECSFPLTLLFHNFFGILPTKFRMFTENSKRRSRTFDVRDSVFQVFFSMQVNYSPGFIVAREHLRHDFYA